MKRGWTALHYAIKHRWLGTAGLLLNEWGAALDVLDRKGRCAFEIATRNPRVQALLREDIDQCYTMTILK
jgi:ankyrin repeat protein